MSEPPGDLGLDDALDLEPGPPPVKAAQEAGRGSATPPRGGGRPRLRIGMWWRVALVAGMLYAFILVLGDIARAGGLTWRGGYLGLAVCLAPLEAYISNRMIKRRQLRGDDRRRFRLAEVVMLVVVLQLLRFLWQGLPHLGGKIERLFDVEFFLGSLIMLGCWSLVALVVQWLEEIEFQPSEAPLSATAPGYDLWVGSHTRRLQHTAAFKHVRSLYLAGAVLMLLMAAMAQVNPGHYVDFGRTGLRYLILHVLLYFVLGLALIAEARLSLLHTTWQHQEVDISPQVARRWPWLVLALLGISVAISLVLPVQYSVGLIETLSYALNLLFTVLVTLLYLLLFLVGLLLYPLRWLLARGQGGEAPPPPEFQQPPEAAPPAATGHPLLDTIKSLVFWLVALAVVAYALYNFAREHRSSLENLPILRSLYRLGRWLAGAWQALRRRASQARLALAARLARPPAAARAGAQARRAKRLGRLTPRQLVLQYYLATMRRASSVGLHRRPSQTPDEYSDSLAGAVPEVHPDLTALTGAFVEARYSEHQVDAAYAHGLKPYFVRVKRALGEWVRKRAQAAPRGPVA